MLVYAHPLNCMHFSSVLHTMSPRNQNIAMPNYFNVVVHIMSGLDSVHYAEPFSLCCAIRPNAPASSARAPLAAPLTSTTALSLVALLPPPPDDAGWGRRWFWLCGEATSGRCTWAAIYCVCTPCIGSKIPDSRSHAHGTCVPFLTVAGMQGIATTIGR
jgi:hypothetical protein